MALTSPTTIAAAMAVTDLAVTVTSATGLAAGNFLRIDNEFMIIDRSYVSGTRVPVYRRGDQGSRVVAHQALAPCISGLFSDQAALGTYAFTPVPLSNPDIVTYSVTGAIAVPVRDTMVVLDKAGVAVMTLAAPAADQDGMILYVTSTTAQAHTITATSLLADGASGSPHTTATFAAYKGAGLVLVALQGLWQVRSNVGITIS